MKGLKKILGLMFALAMVVAFAAPSMSKAAAPVELASTDFVISFTNEEVTITTNAPSVLFSDSLKGEKGAKTVWDRIVVDGGSTKVDFSYARTTADVVLYFKSGDAGAEKIIGIKIPKQTTDLAAYFVGDPTDVNVKGTSTKIDVASGNIYNGGAAGSIYLTTGKGSEAKQLKAVSSSKVYYRKGSTTWAQATNSNMGNEELNKFAVKGTTLYLRINPTDTASGDLAKDTELSTADVEVYGPSAGKGSRASKEVKVSIPKQANAPAVTVNGTTYALSLKAGMEYSVDGGTEWVNVKNSHSTNDKVGVVTMYDLLQKTAGSKKVFAPKDGASLLVRTAATATKAASKIKDVVVDAVVDPTLSAANISAVYTVGYDDEKGITIKNADITTAYQFAIVDKTKLADLGITVGSDNAVTMSSKAMTSKDIKWVTAKAAAKADTPSVVKVAPTAYKDIKTNYMILVRKATVAAKAKKGENPAVAFAIASNPVVLTNPTKDTQTLTLAAANSGDSSKVVWDADASLCTITVAEGTSVLELPVSVTLEKTAATKAFKKSPITKTALKGVTASTDTFAIAGGNATSKLKIKVAANKSGSAQFELKLESMTATIKVVVTPKPTATPAPTPTTAP